jgi:type I restriction-modification system DNA methylase subunit
VIDDLIASFSPENFAEWCRQKFDRFTADLHPASDPGDFLKADIVGYVQSLPDEDTNRPLLVMAVHAGTKINERSSRRRQFDFARKQLQAALDRPPAKVKGLFTQGLFAFYDENGDFRLSLVTGRAEGRRLVYSDFKRQSFFVQSGRNNKTFRARMEPAFSSFPDLANAFSVETLTKEFYNELFAWYERAMAPASKVTFPNDLSRDDDDRNLLAEHLIRLITRLMFVWFIRQKGLIPPQLFDQDELKTLLKTFDPASPKQDNYYRAILQNLFFATLNCEIDQRDFATQGTRQQNKEHYGIKILYRYADEFACSQDDVLKLYRIVPFLNGGLFECLDKKPDAAVRSPVLYHDGFSREPDKCAHIPNKLFFDEHGLVTLFSRYDFTVDENSPNDVDVALDPELLGKVFENLLGAYNPETQETARKSSGSFYTPRNIVNYMVEESLLAHLRKQVPAVEERALHQLLSEEGAPPLTASHRRALVEAIYHCRILDPACGSGAFPMGLLLKMVHLLQRLDPKNVLWHEVVLAEAEKALAETENLDAAEKRERRQRITGSFDQNVNQPDYARKLYLIENCIFGVDIQPIAVQIAKLRAFITLVCDQEPRLDDPKNNYGMLPLPNLETKFVAANSLITLSADFSEGLQPADGGTHLDDPELTDLRNQLADVRHQHFRARTSSDKNACRRQDKNLRTLIKTRLVQIATTPDAAKIAHYEKEIAALQVRSQKVAAENWQNVVQAKPTQTDFFQADPPAVQTLMRVDVNKQERDKIDDAIHRWNRLIEAEKNRAKNKSAFQEEADALATWDPYDQNTSSPFFDPKWMFDVRTGFDIVLGNPPYSAKQSKENRLYRELYTCVEYKCDPFAFFIEFALRSVTQGGMVTFIVPVTWMTNVYYEKLRHLMIDTKSLSRVNLIEGLAFEAANVDTSLLFLRNKGVETETFEWAVTDPTISMPKLTTRTYASVRKEGRYDIVPTVDTAWDSVRDKLERETRKLGSFAKISLGMKLAGNDRFVVPDRDARHPDPIVFGNDIEYYGRLAPKHYFCFATAEIVGGTKNPTVHKTKNKILVQAIRNLSLERRIVGTLDSRGLCFVGTVNAIVPTEAGWDELFLLGLINSRLLNAYFRHRFTTISLTSAFLGELPIKPATREPERANRIVELVRERLAETGENKTKLEHDIDHQVYSLYGLTDADIAVVEKRTNQKTETNNRKSKENPEQTRAKKKTILTDDPDLA